MTTKSILPGPYPIKIVTRNNDTTLKAVLAIVRKHFPDYDIEKTKQNISKGNQYISTTVTVYAEKEEQVKAFDKDLKQIPNVIMVI